MIGDVPSEGDGSGPGNGSDRDCGNITIEGGTITIGKVSWYSPAIGTLDASCKNITITGENTTINVQKGRHADYFIGCSQLNGKVNGTITVGGGATINGTKYTTTHTGLL